MLLRQSTDTDTYKLKLLSCFLYVPIAQLSSVSFSEIERVLTSKSVAIHYRKIEIRMLSLSAGKEEYNSENLFASDCPCRIVICFLKSKNKTGSYDLNPFDFRRSWEVTVNSVSSQDPAVTEREKYLEKKLLDFEKQLAFFKSCVTLVSPETEPSTSGKGKGKGKKSTSNAKENESSSIFTRFRTSFSGAAGPAQDTGQDGGSVRSEGAASSSSSSFSGPPPPYNEARGATTKTIFIKQVDLLLNGAPLDQIETRETGKNSSEYFLQFVS